MATEMPTKVLSLGESLVEQRLLRTDKLRVALDESKRSGRMLGRVLVEKGMVTEEQIAKTLANQINVPYIDLRRFDVTHETVQTLSEIQARRFRALVLEDRADTYLVGFVDPNDLRAQDEIAMLVRRPIDVAMITNEQLIQTIDRIYRKTSQISEFAREVERDVDVVDIHAINVSLTDEDAPVVKLLQTLFEDAAQIRASDIHIEPQETKLVVRFRIDGVLHIQAEADRKIAPALTVRLKLMASLDIGERRLPQDGRMSVKTKTQRFDVRMSTIPTEFGESVVLRLLIQEGGVIALEQSGIPPEKLEKLNRLIQAPHGIVIVTGPTGSGKTTTLYGALHRLNKPGVKILTCEDPVEYRLNGVSQVQVNEKIDLGFARVLRAFLRQDPDIMLVGEIRDHETAEIASRAAMTGHLVLTTLHTNDAVSTAGRLIDLGLPPYMVASTLLGVVAQRLLRRICRYCSQPYKPAPDEMEWVKHHLGEDTSEMKFRHGKGCSRCNGIGYSGRTGVFELLVMTAPLAAAIHTGDSTAFEHAAREQLGDDTLGRQALDQVLAGDTTVSEARSVVSSIG
jgi:MSHA biogenesis protein MshE